MMKRVRVAGKIQVVVRTHHRDPHRPLQVTGVVGVTTPVTVVMVMTPILATPRQYLSAGPVGANMILLNALTEPIFSSHARFVVVTTL